MGEVMLELYRAQSVVTGNEWEQYWRMMVILKTGIKWISEIRTNMDMRKKGLLFKLKVRIQVQNTSTWQEVELCNAPVFMLNNKANLRLY